MSAMRQIYVHVRPAAHRNFEDVITFWHQMGVLSHTEELENIGSAQYSTTGISGHGGISWPINAIVIQFLFK